MEEVTRAGVAEETSEWVGALMVPIVGRRLRIALVCLVAKEWDPGLPPAGLPVFHRGWDQDKGKAKTKHKGKDKAKVKGKGKTKDKHKDKV
jgi:hypothetical protein